MNSDRTKCPDRHAFTLLEMLLTLSLCVVLMSLVSTALSFYVRQMSTAEQTYRNSQIASAVMQMIEDDLRMTLTARPVDTTPLANVLSAASSPLSALGISSSAASGSSDDLAPDDPSSAGSDSDSSTVDPADAETLNVSLGGSVLQAPGLIGNSTQIQIDVSHLPNLEDTVIDPMLVVSNGNLLDRPSDIKTISYFVQPAGVGGSLDALEQLAASNGLNNAGATGVASSGGLVRRELDRAITSHASLTGGLSRLSSAGEIISPEVTGIQFEYYENGNWMMMYNSDSLGFLPPAIRVTLQIGGSNSTIPANSTAIEPANTYTHVIYLPMSHPEDAQTATEETDTATGDTSGSSGSGSGGSGQGGAA